MDLPQNDPIYVCQFKGEDYGKVMIVPISHTIRVWYAIFYLETNIGYILQTWVLRMHEC